MVMTGARFATRISQLLSFVLLARILSPEGTARSTDLRGSMAAVLAALCAHGTSTILDVHMALRGYNNLEAKLVGLGAQIAVHDGQPDRD